MVHLLKIAIVIILFVLAKPNLKNCYNDVEIILGIAAGYVVVDTFFVGIELF